MSKLQEDYYSWGTEYTGALSQWCLGVRHCLEQDDRIKLLSTYTDGDRIGFVADFLAEIPQRPPIDIRKPERLVVIVGEDRLVEPSVQCLRKSFPSTPHIQVFTCPGHEPLQLCLFDGQYSDVNHDFTPRKLIDLVFDWLKRAAFDELHLPGQPLEPFIFAKGAVILNRDIFTNDNLIECFRLEGKANLLIARQATEESIKNKKELLFFPLQSEPHHGVFIKRPPFNFEELCGLLNEVGIDLKTTFSEYVSKYYNSWKEAKIVIGLRVPKKRTNQGEVEVTDSLAFFVNATLEELAQKLGILTNVTGSWQPFRSLGNEKLPTPALEDVLIEPWEIRFFFSKDEAREISRLANENNPSLLLVGAGALGSQVALTLGKQGFGNWAICDEDRLLPHNLPRHGLLHCYTGREKAFALAHAIDSVFDGEGETQIIEGMFPEAIVDKEEFEKKIDVLVDFSASESVINSLSRSPFGKPCLSGFVNHTAETGVILHEGLERKVRLDDLYQQFYAEISTNKRFKQYFVESNRIIAYAGACRDRSFQIAGDLISLQAAAMSAYIRSHLLDKEPSIHLWMWNAKTMSLIHENINVHSVTVFESNGWTVRVSQFILHQIESLRAESLPKETGGILLGKFDLNFKKIYISSLLPAPNNSVMTERSFIRGNNGLLEKVNEINAKVRAISYVGEWHTHPSGSSNRPSQRDKETLKMLLSIMKEEMLPAVIVIKGDEPGVYVEVSE